MRIAVSKPLFAWDCKEGDNELIPALVEQAQANLPPQRLETMAYDKAADDEKVHECSQ
jgi:hypothetical protein